MRKIICFLLLSVFFKQSFAQVPSFSYANGVTQRNYTVASAISTETPTATNAQPGSYVKGVVTDLVDYHFPSGGAVSLVQPGSIIPAGNNYLITSGNGSLMTLDYGGPQPVYSGNPNFGNPFGVANAAAGTLISDPLTNRIYLMQGSSRLIVGGNSGTPQAGYTNGSPGAAPLFNGPMAILNIPFLNNKIWIADKNNNLVRILDVASQTTVDLAITGVTLSGPVGLAYDDTNKYLYITDSHRLIRVSINTTTGQPTGAATVVGGSTTSGDVDGIAGVSRLNQPYGITYQSIGNNIIIADRLNNKIKMYSPLTGQIISIAGNGTSGDVLGQGTAAKFNQPTAVYCNYQTQVVEISDYGNNKLKTVTLTSAYTSNPALPAGLFLNPFTGAISGTPTAYSALANYTITLDNGTSTAQVVLPIQVTAQGPSGLTYSSNSNVYTVGTAITNLVPSNTVGVLTSYSIQPSLPAGLTLNTSTGIISGTPTQASAQTNYTITGTNTGGSTTAVISIYVQGPPYNMGFSRSQAVLLQNAPVYIAALPTSFPAPTSYSLTSSSPALPTGLTLNTTTGEITGTPTQISANTTYTVQVTNAFGTASGTIQIQVQPSPSVTYTAQSPFLQGQAITPVVPALVGLSVASNSHTWSRAFYPNQGTLFYTEFMQHGSQVSYILDPPATNLYLFNDPTITGLGGTAGLGYPGGPASLMTIDPQYFLYNINNNSHQITKFPAQAQNLPGGAPSTLGAVNQWGSTTTGYLDGPAYQARFGTMGQITTDAVGSHVWVPDRTNKRIRVIDARTNMVTTLAGNGTTGSSNGPALSASFTDPAAVTYGADGNIYVLDQVSSGVANIRKIDVTAGTVSLFTTLNVSGASQIINDYLVTDKGGEMYVSISNANAALLKRISIDGSIHDETAGAGSTDLNGLSISPDNGNVIASPKFLGPSFYPWTYVPGESIIITPTLFTGLSFDPLTGTISGTPTGAGLTSANNTQTYTITATNRVGIFRSNITLTVVRPPSGLSYQYSPWNIQVGSNTTANTVNNATIAVGGLPAETYSISPALPPGLSINPATGVISGTSVSLSPAQAYTITASNAYGSTTATVTISIIDKPNPAYSTPQVYPVNTAIAPLTPTNTGGAVLSPAYERVSTLFTMPTGFAATDAAQDASGNFYFTGKNAGVSKLLKVDPTGTTLLNTWNLPFSNAANNLAINGNTAYIGEVLTYDVYQLDISNNTSTAVKIISAMSTPDFNFGNSQFNNLLYYNGKLYCTGEDIGISAWTVTGAPGTPAAPSLDFNYTGTAYSTYPYPNPGWSSIQEMRIFPDGKFLFPGGFGGIPLGLTTYNSSTKRFNTAINIPYSSASGYDATNNVIEAPVNGGQFTKNTTAGVSTSLGSVIGGGGTVDGYIPAAVGGNAPLIQNVKRLFVQSNGDLIFFQSTNNIFNPTSVCALRKYENRVAYSVSPALPAGLQIDPQTGIISGTPTATQAATNYIVTAYNSVGSRSTTVSIAIVSGPSFSYQLSTNTGLDNNSSSPSFIGQVANPRFGVNTFNNARFGQYSVPASGAITLQTTSWTDPAGNNATSPVTLSGALFSISPALPAGLTLNTSTGTISGTVTAARALTTYTVTATNAYGTSTATLQFDIAGPATLSYGGNQTFVNNTAASVNPLVGGISGTATYALTSGPLPTGVTLNTSTGVLSYNGTGAAASSRSVTISVTGSVSGSASSTFTVAILASGTGPSALNYNGPFNLSVGGSFSVTPSVTPGTAGAGGVTYSISPYISAIPGLSFNPATGAITGTPTAITQATSLVVTATTIYGSTTQTVTIGVGGPPSALSYSSASYTYWQGDPVNNIAPTFTQGSTTSTFTATGLPAGLSIDPVTGTIYGLPTTVQAATVATVTASNSFGSVNFGITYRIVATPTISYAPSYTYITNQAITIVTPTVTGGLNNGFTVSPSMPVGLAYAAGTGIISGTPTVTQTAVTYTATISSTLNGVSKTATSSFSVTIGQVPSALSYTSPQVLGVNVRMIPLLPSITPGSGTLTYSAVGLPAGILIDPNTGAIYGTPTTTQAAANASITVTSVYGTASAMVQFTVGAAPSNLSYTPVTLAAVGGAVSLPPAITPGTGSTTYSISPGLPAGLSFNPATGVISGSTNVVSNNIYTVTATNAFGSTTSLFQVTTGNPPTLSYNTPNTFNAGATITALVPTVTAGTGVATYTISPTLPGSLALDPNTGAISGTLATGIAVPMATYTVTSANAFGSGTAPVQIEVLGPPTNLTYGGNFTFTVGTAIPATVVPTVVANPAVVLYTISPSLPAGLSLNATTGAITGTPTAVQSAISYTLTANNFIAPVATYTFTITVLGSAPTGFSYNTPNVYIAGTAITALTPTIAGATPITYTISPALPGGLSINAGTGVISGTPTAGVVSAATVYTITATNSFGSASTLVSIQVQVAPIITYSSSYVFTINTAITSVTPTVVASPAATFSISPALPAGLSFNIATGVITGTPTVTLASTSFTVTASNGLTPNGTSTFTITVVAGAPTGFSYNTPNVYIAGTAITALTPTIAGATPITYTISPALPGGLSINAGTGVISGTPTAGVVSAATVYTITATNSFGSASTLVSIQVQVAPVITYSSSYVFTRNTAITSVTPTVVASPAATFSISPALPAGLSFNTATGVISGTPTVTLASTSFTVTASNGLAPNGTSTFTITVVAGAPTGFSYNTPNVYIAGTAITALTPTIAGATPITYTISPALPGGLSINAGTGVISGTPTAGVVSAATVYTITATNSFGNASTLVSIQVQVAPVITYSSSYVFTRNTAITSVTPTVVASPAATFSISPALPAGLSFNTATGVISGTPTVTLASTSFTVTASNGLAPNGTSTFTIMVGAPPVITYVTPQVYIAGTAITALTPNLTNGATAFVIAPSLPTGLSLSSTTGVITGTPTVGVVSAAATYTITATNNFGSGSAILSIQIQSAPTSLSYGNLVFTQNTPISPVSPSVIASPAPAYSISPGLPAGLVFNTATGMISGTPTVTLPSTSFTVTANNGLSPNATTTFTILVGAPPVISYVTPQVYMVGSAITPLMPNIQNTATTWSVLPALPSGLSLNTSTGVITGTPIVSSVAAPYTITAINSFGSGTTILTISAGVLPSGLSYTLPTSNFPVNTSIGSLVPALLAGTGPITYSVGPSLPAGLSINPLTGVITGTPTGATAATTYTVTASNAYGSVSTTINFATGIAPSSFSYTTPNSYIAGIAISALNPTITAGSGTLAYTISPSLPGGLSINPATGVISGTPTAGLSSPVTTYTVTASSVFGTASAQLSIIVSGPPTGLSYGGNYVFVVNNTITPVLPTVISSPAPTGYTISPLLPAGLSLNATTGAITGTPTVVTATASYTVTVSNGIAPGATVVFTISVQTPPVISYVTPQNYVTGSAITPLVPSVYGGGTNWTVSPALPAGLSINTTLGVISGTPTAANTATPYTVTAVNAYGSGSTVVTISTGNAPSGLGYILPGSSLLLNASIGGMVPTLATGTGPLTFSISPTLPSGLTINPATGIITGTPVAATSITTYTITVTNPYGSTSTPISFATGSAPSNLSYTSPNVFVAGTVITALNPTLTTGPGAVAYTISPSLPAGLSISASTGMIFGTPQAGQSSPATNYTVTATNAFGSTSAQLSITVSGPPVSVSYPNITVVLNVPMVPVLPTVSSSPAPTLYTINTPLPPGLSFNPLTGAITGTPIGVASATSFTVTVSNGINPTINTSFTITVQLMPTISYVTPQNYVVGIPIAALTPTLSGTANSWIIAPALPSGLALDPVTGLITGTPTVVSTATAYSITATNAFGSGSAIVTIATGNAPSGLTYPSMAVPVNTPITPILPSLSIGTGPFSYTGPALPAGLIFNPATGAITGTPTNLSGTATYTATISSPFGSTTTTFTLSLGVGPSSLNYPTPNVFNAGVVITPLSPTILIGTAAPVYVISPALPVGLSINASTGIISGTPAAGTFVPNVVYTVTASNSFGSVSAPVAIMINGLPTVFTYPTPNVYTVGTPIAQLVPTVQGGVFNTYTIAPTLPAGLVLNTLTGVITGTPPTAVSAAATYTVTGINASGSLTAALQITVNDIPPATFTYNPSPVTVKNGVTVVRSVPVASGGGTVTNYSISPALPQGMVIDPVTGIISGIPIAPAGATLTYTITASNSGGSTTAKFVMLVDAGAPIPVPQNIVTPNNDGVNDFWVIPGITAYRNAEIAIYDKAGRTVYHKSGGYNNDWDGRLNGMPLKNDTYYYIIFINQDGIKPMKGYITIIH